MIYVSCTLNGLLFPPLDIEIKTVWELSVDFTGYCGSYEYVFAAAADQLAISDLTVLPVLCFPG